MTVATLAAGLYPEAANRALARASQEALKSGHGYAAREVTSFKSTTLSLGGQHRPALVDGATAPGLGSGALPDASLNSLLVSVDLAKNDLGAAIGRQ